MASQSSDNNGVSIGQQQPESLNGDYNAMSFVIQQALAKLSTATLVKVLKCTNDGGLSPVGFVDVQPLVNQIDLNGTPNPHVTIFNVPYFRMQGGSDAIVMDPKPGDIGMAAFASRDITKVKNTRNRANPGSYRQFSMADGLYMGGFLNGAPTQYVQFSADGIRIHSPVAVKLEAPSVEIHAGERFTWDVAGFGESWEHTGGIDWTHRLWQTGANVTTITGPISPPDGTPA